MTGRSVVDLVVVPMGDVTAATIATLMPRLTPEERVRRDRYVREEDRHAFVVTRALVRAVLSMHGPSTPDAWRFATNAHGCPSVIDAQAGSPRLEFNVSHTAGLVAMAVGSDGGGTIVVPVTVISAGVGTRSGLFSLTCRRTCFGKYRRTAPWFSWTHA